MRDASVKYKTVLGLEDQVAMGKVMLKQVTGIDLMNDDQVTKFICKVTGIIYVFLYLCMQVYNICVFVLVHASI